MTERPPIPVWLLSIADVDDGLDAIPPLANHSFPFATREAAEYAADHHTVMVGMKLALAWSRDVEASASVAWTGEHGPAFSPPYCSGAWSACTKRFFYVIRRFEILPEAYF